MKIFCSQEELLDLQMATKALSVKINFTYFEWFIIGNQR